MKKITLSGFFLLCVGITNFFAQKLVTEIIDNEFITIPIVNELDKPSDNKNQQHYTLVKTIHHSETFSIRCSMAQEEQKPTEMSLITNLDKTKSNVIDLLVFPNPTTDLLKLKVDCYEEVKLLYQLFDINGKLLEEKTIVANETNIGMSDFPQATYFLKVIQDNKTIKTVQIIKN